MKALLPDGRRCGVYNDYPRFFDDSFVFIGAERSAKVMSNMTARMAGERGYSQTIYPFKSTIVKAASAIDADYYRPHDVNPQQEEGNPLLPDQKPEKSEDAPDPAEIQWDIERKLTRVASTMPVATERERQALEFYMQDRIALERINRGLMSRGEYDMWKRLSIVFFQREHGTDPEALGFLKDQFETRLSTMFGVEKAASMPKWAEIYKQIPGPTSKQLSVIHRASTAMPPLSKDILDLLAKEPRHSLRIAGDMGVVLRPREFQYVMLRQRDPEQAEHLHANRRVFRPSSCLPDAPAFGRSASLPQDVVSAVAKALAPLLSERSFAPSAVRVRIMRMRPHSSAEKVAEVTVDGLEEVADLYNEYRAGLIQHKPDWSTIAVPRETYYSLGAEGKLASDSSTLSDLLLHLAYWPGIRLGLGSPAEEEKYASEDATFDNHTYSL
jgi:hypothetical protein